MRLIVLASGSSGNTMLIESDGRGVLLDAGISARETLRRIDACGAAGTRIDAILLTHEHSDHVSGARVLARRLGIPVIATRGTLRGAERCLADVPETVGVEYGDRFEVGGLTVTVFATSHDATQPAGFTFDGPDCRRVGVLTDTGVVTATALEALAGCHVLGIETNHDSLMLERGTYPQFLKRRIAGDQGHLSNDAAAAALAQIRWSGLAHVFGLHLSEENNTHAAASAALTRVAGDPASPVTTVGRQGGGVCEL